jgi:chain length determinant protein tyrosine kinase EpsG
MKPENIVPFSATSRVPQSIGSILVDGGKLSIDDAERVLQLQRQEKIRFGDAALKLKVVTQRDIDFALSRQFHYDYLQPGSSDVSANVIAAYDPFNAEVEGFRTLRSQLMLRWFDGDPTRRVLAVVSPEAREGRSFITANLAVVFAQLGERVLVVDADLRAPVQHALFGLENRTGLSTVLAGRQDIPDIRTVTGLEHLSVLTSGPLPPNPIELLSRPDFTMLLGKLRERFDVILLDSPAATRYADAQVLAARTAGALMVVRKDGSRADAARDVASILGASTTLVGTVLNEC